MKIKGPLEEEIVKRGMTGVTYVCGKGERMPPEDHKQKNHLSLLALSFLLAETDGSESD